MLMREGALRTGVDHYRAATAMVFHHGAGLEDIRSPPGPDTGVATLASDDWLSPRQGTHHGEPVAAAVVWPQFPGVEAGRILHPIADGSADDTERAPVGVTPLDMQAEVGGNGGCDGPPGESRATCSWRPEPAVHLRRDRRRPVV